MLRRGMLRQPQVAVGQGNVEVLPFSDGTAYLGRYLCFEDFSDVEIGHWMERGWAAFGQFRSELCGSHYSLRSRLQLFDSVVTAIVLNGGGCLTTTAEKGKPPTD
eukprot:9475904-Pyramimonas_sp.AAC.1